MPQQTQNYKLNTWLATDRFILSELNNNFTTIDATMKSLADAKASLDSQVQELNKAKEALQSSYATLDTMQKQMNSSLTSLSSKYEVLNKTVQGLSTNSKIKFTTWTPTVTFNEVVSTSYKDPADWPQIFINAKQDSNGIVRQSSMCGITFEDMGLPSSINLEAALVFGMNAFAAGAYHETKSATNAIEFPVLVLPVFLDTSTYRNSADYVKRERSTVHVMRPFRDSNLGATYKFPYAGDDRNNKAIETYAAVIGAIQSPISYTPSSSESYSTRKGNGGRGIWFGWSWYNQNYFLVSYPYAIWLWYSE